MNYTIVKGDGMKSALWFLGGIATVVGTASLMTAGAVLYAWAELKTEEEKNLDDPKFDPRWEIKREEES